MTLFTLIAYKPNSSAYFRREREGEWDSDCETFVNMTWEQLLKNWSEIKSRPIDSREKGYVFTICAQIAGYNCCLMYDGNVGDYSDLPDEVRYSEEYAAAERAVQTIVAEDASVKKALEEAELEKARQREAAAKRERERQEQANRAWEISDLKKLRAKYPDAK